MAVGVGFWFCRFVYFRCFCWVCGFMLWCYVVRCSLVRCVVCFCVGIISLISSLFWVYICCWVAGDMFRLWVIVYDCGCEGCILVLGFCCDALGYDAMSRHFRWFLCIVWV